jgi:ethanolamine utilization protein EutQ (cupin superfamily)
MKTLFTVVVASTIMSSVSFAGGLHCVHPKYHVHLDNKAGLVVSTKDEGAVLRLSQLEIAKSIENGNSVFQGSGFRISNGHVASVSLTLQKEPASDELDPIIFEGDLTIVIEGEAKTAALSCTEYQQVQ